MRSPVEEPAITEASATPPTTAPGPSGLKRVAGITASLVGTQAFTSILGLAFWTLAARTFAESDVGVAGAAVAMMMLLGSLGSLGLGTLLIAKLPHTHESSRRVLVRTSLFAAGVTGGLLAVVVPLVAVHAFGADNLRPLVGTPLALAGLALGTGLMSVILVLDQAVLTIGVGNLQLERNIVASVVKIGALLGLNALGAGGGMAIFLAWTIGSLVSLPLVSFRTRGGRAGSGRLIDLRLLRGMGRDAASHHALNITIQATLQILPIMVTVLLSAQENAYFNSAVLVSGFVFALPFAISVGLFAAARGDEREVLSRMRLTIPVGLAVSLSAIIVIFPLAPLVLNLFGSAYSDEGANILRALVLAGLPFVIKDHFVALRRVQGRTTEATLLLVVFTVLELVAAAIGAELGGTVGLCLGFVGVLVVEALILAVPLYRGYRQMTRTTPNEGQNAVAVSTSPGEERLGGHDDERSALRRGPDEESRMDRATPDTGVTSAGAGGIPDVPAPQLPAGAEAAATPVAGARTATAERPVEQHAATGDPGPSNGSPRPGRLRRLLTGPDPQAPLVVVPGRPFTGPVLVVMALGLLLMAVAAASSRTATATGLQQTLWVAGLAIIFVPACVRVLWPRTPHAEWLVLAIALPVLLQLSRLVISPDRFVFHDELIHANTLRQIDETHRLFSENPLLPVSGYYPGLEVVTDALHQTTGLSSFVAGTVVLVAARVILVLALIGLVTLLTGSRRAGAIASVVYVLNSQFLFFNSQYSYQTLALPLAVLTIYLFLTRRRGARTALVLPLAGVAAVALTHHVTAILLVGTFAVWVALAAILRSRKATGTAVDDGRRADDRRDIGGLLVMLGASVVTWLLTAVNPGSPIGSYLLAIVTSSSTDVASLAEGEQTKALFANTAGAGPAPWEQVLIIAAVLISAVALLAALLFGRSRLRRRDAFGVLITLLALLYPVVPGGHLTRATAEVGDRAAGFVFLGIAAVVGWWLIHRRWTGRRSVIGTAVLTVAATITFLGNIVLGSGPTAQQLPGPYLISADARSVDADNLAAAEWMAANLPVESRVYGDRVGGLLAAAYGGQFTVRHVSTLIDASRLLLDPQLTDADFDLIKRAQLEYLIVDRRLANGLPNQQVYIENGEFEGQGRTTPVSPEALDKFTGVAGVQRIYDNGSIVIYDLRELRDAQ
ncbi:hypothetical protein JL107_01500 [Nakamurella flavida]|uniref:Lipopolysaccharide biosynthesis protein n=1 Tax=Nakamurella flavida TaxID=363630 RepID=A0A939C159_9ACTN|nr:hypothetical protein [Nakamurella flavida]MBM9475110.1 hypothetical protein [Nakamurella flavida]MDP9776680.1 O-antigen/teichoic acid export membrane protein [Nakamurella flavida]